MTDQTLSQRIHALIFNGVTKASSTANHPNDWIRLSERNRIAEAVYAELRDGGIEFRLGPLALLAQVAGPAPATTGNPRCGWCVAEGRQCPACADRDGPETGLRSTESAQEPPVGGSGRLDAQAISGAAWICPRCGYHNGGGICTHCGEVPTLRCICNDPPPTVDKPKNGTASRPDGWACPRHGTVI